MNPATIRVIIKVLKIAWGSYQVYSAVKDEVDRSRSRKNCQKV